MKATYSITAPRTRAMRALLRALTRAIRARRLGRIAGAVARASGNRISEASAQHQLIDLLTIMLAGLEKNLHDRNLDVRRSSRVILKQCQQLVPELAPPAETATNGDRNRAR